MWNWSLNWDQVSPSIVIGSCPMTGDDLKLVHFETSVTAVMSLQHDDDHTYWKINYPAMLHTGTELGLVMERWPIRDFDIADMQRQLPGAISILAKLIDKKHRVYLHCTAGLGRSTLVTLGYLTLVENYDKDAAIQLIRENRSGAVPAWDAYYGCCQNLLSRHRPAIARRAYELYESGINNNADTDWLQAQSEILRSSFLQ
jgi:atypical dual specificity phosphatase